MVLECYGIKVLLLFAVAFSYALNYTIRRFAELIKLNALTTNRIYFIFNRK
jgi:hypothetical protein